MKHCNSFIMACMLTCSLLYTHDYQLPFTTEFDHYQVYRVLNLYKDSIHNISHTSLEDLLEKLSNTMQEDEVLLNNLRKEIDF